MERGMIGNPGRASLLAAGLVALSLLLAGRPSSGAEPARDIPPVGDRAANDADGNVDRESGSSTAVPCGKSDDGETGRDGNAGRIGEEPYASDAPCSIETLRKRAANARIS